MKAASDIQAKIMGDPDNIVPELLSTSTVLASSSPVAATAIGVVYALQTLAHEDSPLSIYRAFLQRRRARNTVSETRDRVNSPARGTLRKKGRRMRLFL